MMWNLIKKDFLTISRDRSEVLTLLAMPMILIAILGFALGGIMSGEQSIDEIPLALLVENDFEADIEKFDQALAQEGLTEEAIGQIVASAEAMDPATIFMDIMESPDLEEVIDLRTDYEQEQAKEAIMTDEINAIITIPEGFSYHTLMAFYLEEEPKSTIELLVPDHEQFSSSMVNSILTSFTDQYNLELSILQATEGQVVESELAEKDFGEITHLPAREPVSAFPYYTIGMAVMFALYVASTISSNAFKEKTSHVFARLMLTGERPLRYLLSKMVSATILTMIQLMILFLGSTIVFQTFSDLSLESWIGIIFVTLVFSLTIGSLAVLLTAIALQFNNDAISGIFSGGLVVVFAFLGGSLMPVEQLSSLLRVLGNWTPNGAMMTAYLQLIQGFQFVDVLPMIYRVLGMAILFIILGVAIFPKRRLT